MQRESMWVDLLHGWKGLLFVCLGFFSCGNTQSHTSGWTTYLWRPNGLKSGKDRRPCWPSSQAHRCRCIYIFYCCIHFYTVAYRLHVCASRNLCTSVYQHRMVQVRDTLLQSFRLYHPVLTDISKQSLEVKWFWYILSNKSIPMLMNVISVDVH